MNTLSPFPTFLDAFGISLISIFGASVSAPVPGQLYFVLPPVSVQEQMYCLLTEA